MITVLITKQIRITFNKVVFDVIFTVYRR